MFEHHSFRAWRYFSICLGALFFTPLLATEKVGAAEFVDSALSAKQGQTLSIVVAAPEQANPGVCGPVINFRNHIYKTFPLASQTESSVSGIARKYRALITIPANLDPGPYKISCEGHEQALKVVSGGFPVQSMRLPKSKNNFDGSPGEKETVDAAKQTVSEMQLWKGKFVCPCKARISAGFGLKRSVNGKLLKDYFHSGLDYAGGLGAPVYATQSGKVLLTHMGWKLHGNIIGIDHGQGVISFYLHLSKILVKEGQVIAAGDKIGAVGSTGRANGPHLHFSIYVNNEAANPESWFKQGF